MNRIGWALIVVLALSTVMHIAQYTSNKQLQKKLWAWETAYDEVYREMRGPVTANGMRLRVPLDSTRLIERQRELANR